MSVRRSPVERPAVFFAALCLLVLFALAAQFRSYASPDTGFLLHEAARVLDGARLYVDLIDMNPPATVLLNMGAVLLARELGIPEILAYRLGCIALLLATLSLAAWLMRRLFPDDIVFRRTLILLLALAVFNLAERDFGEREHLLLALIVPYLLLSAARAVGREIPMALAASIGLLAGSAFAFKPHFVLLWPAIEGYLRLTRRVQWGEVLPETVALGGFLALYVAAILLWAPEYLQVVQSFAGSYTGFLYVPFWQLLLRGPGALLTVYAFLAFLALGRQARRPELAALLALGAVVCLLAGAAQQKGFSYHFYPSFALATVLLGVLATGAEVSRTWVHRVYRVIASSVLATVVVVVCVRNLTAVVEPVRDAEQEQMEGLLPVVRTRGAGESVYVMSYNISSAFPLINYAGARSASRFPQLWILGSAYIDQLRSPGPIRYRDPGEMSPSERYLNQAVFEDLRDQRPKLLVVLQHARDLPANGFRRLNYVGYFRRDPRIAGILDRYQLVADVGDFVVYERIADGSVRTGSPPTAQPGNRDILQSTRTSGLPVRIGDPALLFAVCTFVVSAIVASLAERTRAGARIAPESASG